MAELDYLNFDLKIERLEQGYRAEVLSSPAGEARADVPAALLSPLDLSGASQTVGGQLFEAVFRDEVLGCLRRSLDEAGRQGKGLRIRLRLADVPDLANLPWEYLYDHSRDNFLTLSRETPLVRYLDLPEPPRGLETRLRLRVLAVIASPQGYPALDTEREWANLKEALHDLEARGLVALERLDPPSIEALQRSLLGQEYHILHFLGHGSFDEQTQQGLLLLQDKDGKAQVISGQEFSTLLRDHRSLRLILLNACEGAEAAVGDAYSGVAQQLVRDGIPAVIAMRTTLSDEAGVALARSFYTALADGAPVDTALSEARKALFTGGYQGEWGTPVLYMRAPDGDLWRRAEMARPAGRRKLVSAIGLAATLVVALAVLAFEWPGWARYPRARAGETLIVIGQFANYTGGAQGYNVAGRLRGALERELTAGRLSTVRAATWPDVIPDASAAESVAKRAGAPLVIWGEYDSGRVLAHFTVPGAGQEASGKEVEKLAASPAELSTTINGELPEEIRYLALLTMGQVYADRGPLARAAAILEQAAARPPIRRRWPSSTSCWDMFTRWTNRPIWTERSATAGRHWR
jgi:hypothetical protein